ncbi:MAG: hypothetical protein ACLU63_05955 [Monoglobus pectinilyticus]
MFKFGLFKKFLPGTHYLELDSLFTALGGVGFETRFKDEGFNSGGWGAGYYFDFIGSDLGYAMYGYIVFAYWNL